MKNFIYALSTDIATHQIVVAFLARRQQQVPLLPPFHNLQSAGYESL